MKKLVVPFTLILAMVLSSCTQRILDFTIVSSKNVDLSKAASFQRGKARVTGEDAVFLILGFGGIPNMKEAIDRAIEQTPGAVALVDGVVSYKAWSAILVGKVSYVVEGSALVDPSMSVNSDVQSSPYKYVQYDDDGNVVDTKILTKEEYEAYKAEIVK